jgi:hypothetical protein
VLYTIWCLSKLHADKMKKKKVFKEKEKKEKGEKGKKKSTDRD